MIKETDTLVDFQRYKVRKEAARRYWLMTKCSATKLAEYMQISLHRAFLFEKQFINDYIKRGKDAANKR